MKLIEQFLHVKINDQYYPVQNDTNFREALSLIIHKSYFYLKNWMDRMVVLDY